jgi:putative aminopeptidase FrvX
MNIDLLRRLCETPGVPGHEHRVRELITAEIEGLFDEVTVDPMGSLLCRRNSRKAAKGSDPKKVMLLCHMDEIGFWFRMSRTRVSCMCSLLADLMHATCSHAVF